jgi:outer membrane protein TolC
LSGSLLGLALLALGGCATYSALPLPDHSSLGASVAATGVPPLDMDAVATLAVLNNPDLKAARAASGVAQAQAFAAGLLPDPQFSYSAEHPLDHVISPADPRYPEYNAYGLGLSLDLQTLLTHSSNRAAASAAYRQARLDLLWQEWQTVAQARTLYVQQAVAEQRHAFLERAEQIYALAAARSQRAQAAGNATLADTSADEAVLLDVRTQLGTAGRSGLQARQALRTLLGVGPDVTLQLQPLSAPPIPARTAVQTAVAHLTQKRPDLRALQAGYGAQEARLRAAVLSQFPDISLGVTRARDVSNVHTIGASVSLTLPLFNRGRGQIAIERTTRAQLRSEYQARLDHAVGDVWQLWSELQQLDGQLHRVDQQLPRLQNNVEAATRAYQAGDFPAASYLALVGSYLAAREARADLMQNLWTDSIALATVLGTQVQPS